VSRESGDHHGADAQRANGAGIHAGVGLRIVTAQLFAGLMQSPVKLPSTAMKRYIRGTGAAARTANISSSLPLLNAIAAPGSVGKAWARWA